MSFKNLYKRPASPDVEDALICEPFDNTKDVLLSISTVEIFNQSGRFLIIAFTDETKSIYENPHSRNLRNIYGWASSNLNRVWTQSQWFRSKFLSSNVWSAQWIRNSASKRIWGVKTSRSRFICHWKCPFQREWMRWRNFKQKTSI